MKALIEDVACIIKRIANFCTKTAKIRAYEVDYKQIKSDESSNEVNEYDWYQEDSSDDRDHAAHLENEIGAYLRGIYSPILKFDEFELFRSFLRAFKSHPLQNYVDTELDNRTRTNIDNVRNFVRVQVVDNGGEGQGDLKVRKLLKARKVQKFNNNSQMNNE